MYNISLLQNTINNIFTVIITVNKTCISNENYYEELLNSAISRASKIIFRNTSLIMYASTRGDILFIVFEKDMILTISFLFSVCPFLSESVVSLSLFISPRREMEQRSPRRRSQPRRHSRARRITIALGAITREKPAAVGSGNARC